MADYGPGGSAHQVSGLAAGVVDAGAPAAPKATISDSRQARVVRSLARSVEWVQANHYLGYEPADGNASPLFRLTGGRVLGMRLLQQLVLRAPFNIRPLIGVRPHESAIGRGYMASGHLLMSRHGTARHAHEEAAVACLEWLITNRSAAHSEFCWGDPYEYATRAGRRPKGEPLLIWSALIGHVFLDAFEALGNDEYLDVAASVGRWILKLPVERTTTGSCLSYVAFRQSSIHNASVMGAAFLARLGVMTGNPDALSMARDAAAYTCARQRPDGSWFYAEEAKYHWIDSFHTGYNLSALRTFGRALQDRSVDVYLARGLQYFVGHFFEEDGRPKYFHDRTYPIDIQCAAQAIETLVGFSDEDPGCLQRALAVADWTIEHMQASDGHFYYRDLGWVIVRTPMMHWGQATMIKALARLAQAMEVDSE